MLSLPNTLPIWRHKGESAHTQKLAFKQVDRRVQSVNYTTTIGGVNFFSGACIDPPDLLF